MKYHDALKLVRQRAQFAYGDSAAVLLENLILGLHPGKPNLQITDIETLERNKNTLALRKDMGGISYEYFHKLLIKLKGVLRYRRTKGKIYYQVDLTELRQFDYAGALAEIDRKLEKQRAKRAAKARETYAAQRQAEELENVREVERTFLKRVFDPTSRASAFVKSVLDYQQEKQQERAASA